MDQKMKRVQTRPTRTDRGFRDCFPCFFPFTRIMQLTTEHSEKNIDSKRETISFYYFLRELFYVRLNLIVFKKITREHGGLLEIKSLFKWITSDIPRCLATGLASEYNEKNIPCIEIPCGLVGGSLQVKNTSVNSAVTFKCVFWIYIRLGKGLADCGQAFI